MYPCERFEAEQDIAEDTEQDHFILKSTPNLGKVDKLRLDGKLKTKNTLKIFQNVHVV